MTISKEILQKYVDATANYSASATRSDHSSDTIMWWRGRLHEILNLCGAAGLNDDATKHAIRELNATTVIPDDYKSTNMYISGEQYKKMGELLCNPATTLDEIIKFNDQHKGMGIQFRTVVKNES